MLDSNTSPIQIYLLGQFEIVQGGTHLKADDWSRRKAAMLMQRLAIERRIIKDQAIDFLWPDATMNGGANNLYRTIYALRQTIEKAFGSGTAESIFSFNDGILSLDQGVVVDVHEFEQLANTQSPRFNLAQAVKLYKGTLLPDDLYSDWASPHRERLQRLFRDTTLKLVDDLTQNNQFSQAIAYLNPLIVQDPVDESVHRELMRLYALDGRRHEALRQYQTCVQILEEELGIEPEAQSTTLYEQILSGEITAAAPSATATDAATTSTWTPPAPIALEIDQLAPIVGREQELEDLHKALHLAQQQQGQTILLAGVTGVGKTRLAYEALQTATDHGTITLFGTFYEQEGQIPYLPFIEAINRYLAAQSRPVTDNPITHHKAIGSTDPQQEHWALFNATANFLAEMAQEAPLILFIDDLHAADETSLRLFHFLARQTRSLPICLLATYRTDIAHAPTSPFGVLLNSLYREQLQTIIEVIPLAQTAAANIIAHILEGEPTPELVQAVFEVSEGNPFFVQEMARALVKWEQLVQINGRWQLKPEATLRIPTGLTELMRERIARLGTAVVTTLEAAAIIGRDFGFDILRRLDILPDHDLLDALDTALSGQLLDETGTGYRFQHGFIRHVLYQTQSQMRRTHQHTRIAEAIETAYARKAEGLIPYVESLAFHYSRSLDLEKAIPYQLQAGQKAAKLYAFEVAVTYYQDALTALDESGREDPALRWQILEQLGWWGITLADTVRTVDYFERALSMPASEAWQPQPTDRVRLHRGAAVALLTAGDTEAAEAHLMTALPLMNEHEDSGDYAILLYNIAQLHWHRNEYQKAFDVAQNSLAIAERLNDEEGIARAFEMLALACHSTGDWQQGLLFEEQRAELAGPGLDVTGVFDVHL
ncbi:AAA family ATPase [Candidatus Leptofilum sp.]|uniref:AAA family ATPase n=1 Tax=Candidatus Leptofilum sp. TaxID=3241576 RepID=UPI003B5B1E55